MKTKEFEQRLATGFPRENSDSLATFRELLLRAATFKRREFFRFWNQIQSSDLAFEPLGRKLEMVFERLGELRAASLPSDVRFISWVDTEYPHELFELPQPPLGLFVCGKLLSSKRFAVVGSRTPLSYSQRVTRDLVSRLVEKKWTIVSGGALGIDTIAHETSRGGTTWAILGSGLRRLYPKANEQLFRRIVENGGALISEYPPWTEPRPYLFPERNRLIAALSERLFLAQAHEKSGSLLTARTALDMGREIYVLRPILGDPHFGGSQELIDSGARSVIDASDLELL